MDSRIKLLAQKLVSYSMEVKPGDKVLIEGYDPNTFELVEALVKAVYAAGGMPFVSLFHSYINNALYQGLVEEQLRIRFESELAFMKKMNCYVAIRGSENEFEHSNVSHENMSMFNKIRHPTIIQRVNHTRWVILRWPSASFAQSAKMSTRDFEDFFFKACLTDYESLAQHILPLQKLMEKTDKVRITSPGTDLAFSIKGISAIPCVGKRNIPDGEIFTAPIRDSVNGIITYNTPSVYENKLFDRVRFEFKDGKIINAECGSGSVSALNAILDNDEGARYIGEFAIGFNNQVTKPMLDILFDEKIGGSLHFTPGQAYEVADNGNRSVVHWDLVLRQTADCGGGEIWFDDVLIRKDGKFTLPELLPLNP